MNKGLSKQIITVCVTLALVSVFLFYFMASARVIDTTPVVLVKSILGDLGPLSVGAAGFWLRHLLRFITCVLFFFCAWWLGGFLLGLFGINNLSAEKSILFSTGLGLGILGYLVFLLGVMNLLKPGFMLGLFVILALAAALHTVFSGKAYRLPEIKFSIYCILIAPFLLLAFAATTFPEVFYDALTYHLALPQAYLQEGRMVNLPSNIYSTIPHLASLIYTWGLVLGDVHLVKLMNFCVGLLLVYAVYITGRELAVILMISLPLIALNQWCAGSDIFMTFFLILGLIVFYGWFTGEEGQEKPLYAAGVFLGLAVAAKYTAAFGIPFLAGAVLYRCRKANGRNTVKVTGIFLLFIILPLLPWWIKNCIHTGNPFFPFLTEIFGSGQWVSDSIASFRGDVRYGYNGIGTILNGLMRVIRTGISGASEGRAGFTGPVLLLLLPFMVRAFKDRKVRWSVYYLLSVLVFWLFSTHMVRHLVPHMIVAFIALSTVIERRRTVRVMVIILACVNLYWLVSVFRMKYDGLKVATGRWTSEEYLLQEHPGVYFNPSYGAYRYIRDNVDYKDSRVIILGEARQFYCPMRALCNTVHDIPVFFETVSRCRDVKEVEKWMDSEGVTHIIVNRDEVGRLVPEKYLDKDCRLLLREYFENHTTRMYGDRWVVLYRSNK